MIAAYLTDNNSCRKAGKEKPMRKTLINKANAISYLTEDHRAFTKNDCELITDLPEQAQETVLPGFVRTSCINREKTYTARVMDSSTSLRVTRIST